jgi:hypothetical protein
MSRSPDLHESRINYSALTPYTPYIVSWSEETDVPPSVIERPGRGIGYLDETVFDRDRNGVLWLRALSRRGAGEPVFAKIHPLRQRRAMRRMLCSVCAQPADRNEDGVLWLLKDHREDWPGWPEGMALNEPPVCMPCARLSSRMCPKLRGGAVALRVRDAPISGVYGKVYDCNGPLPVARAARTVTFESPAIRWVVAVMLAREVRDCTIVELADLWRD